MATLMLSSLGTAIGGPLGGAIGALVGQNIDSSLFGGIRSGPRLGDLSLQTSSFGSSIPQIFGTMRVAGSVIWATDLKESSEVASGGKGQPDTVGYSYSASFAVALSSRQAVGIKRIWADGKLLRGTDGDFKVRTEFRFYPGGEDQTIDPLIGSIEGIANTPAYRGLAIAVFEDLELAEFGNRIPILTFEIVADTDDISLESICAEVSSGVIKASEPAYPVLGYAAHGRSIEDAIEPLVAAFGARFVSIDGALRLVEPRDGGVVSSRELGCSQGSEVSRTAGRVRTCATDLPQQISLTYYDPDRDYQSGEKHVSAVKGGQRSEVLELPAVLTSDRVKAIASDVLERRWNERERLEIRLPPRWTGLLPGTVLRLEGQRWIVTNASSDGLVTVAELLRQRGSGAETIPSDPGRAASPPDERAKQTRLQLLDLPSALLPDNFNGLLLAATSEAAQWRPVPVQIEHPGATSLIRSAARRSIMGRVPSPVGVADSGIWDDVNKITVRLDGDFWLESRDDRSLLSDTNYALLGEEIIQFGRAVPTGPRTFALSRLLRGRFGTEWAIAGHRPDETFVLLDSETLQRVSLTGNALGAEVAATPLGLADSSETSRITRTWRAEGLRPPSPAHLAASWRSDESLEVTWVRRSRLGWSWPDETDAPLAEATEAYRATLTGAGGSVEKEVATPHCRFDRSLVAFAGLNLSVAVIQIGDFGASRETTIFCNPRER